MADLSYWTAEVNTYKAIILQLKIKEGRQLFMFLCGIIQLNQIQNIWAKMVQAR